MKAKERHKLARTDVDVYRLFKIRDFASALRLSGDPLIASLGSQMLAEALTMLKPYCAEQQAIIDRDLKPKAALTIRMKRSLKGKK